MFRFLAALRQSLPLPVLLSSSGAIASMFVPRCVVLGMLWYVRNGREMGVLRMLRPGMLIRVHLRLQLHEVRWSKLAESESRPTPSP